jgi:ElaB/YqjD/DUF883 family membrane-anchored ribosome-binding protein
MSTRRAKDLPDDEAAHSISTISTAAADTRLDAAVGKLRTDYEQLVEDSGELALEAARALAAAAAELARALAASSGHRARKAADAAWDEIRQRPLTAAAVAIAGASTALAAALSRRQSRPKPPAAQ